VATIMALVALTLFGLLGGSLVMTVVSETYVSANYRTVNEALYAADAALQRTLPDLFTVADWDQVLAGTVRSSFADGLPTGQRLLSDGTPLDLAQVVSAASCAKSTTCTTADMTAATTDRPWGMNNPQWRLFAYGRLSDLSPLITSAYYVVVLVGDDPSETDGDPLHDGVAGNPGAGILALRAEAFGPRGSHRVVEATVSRVDPTGLAAPPPALRVLSWRLIR